MKKYNVPALEKAMAILDLIATSDGHYSITDIHKTLNISKSTVFTTLNVLEHYHYVKKNEEGNYEIGFKLYQLGMMYQSKNDVKKMARPYLEKLMSETGFTVHLGILDDGEILFVDKIEPNTFIKFSTFPGMRSDIHISALGKAISAFLKEEQLEQIIQAKGLKKYTSKTITDKSQFREQLKLVLKNGYAVEDEEGEVGVRCIGAPLFRKEGEHPVAAISVTSVKSELTEDRYEEIGQLVISAADAISKQLTFT